MQLVRAAGHPKDHEAVHRRCELSTDKHYDILT
jgi:hypothetical protein